HGCHQSLQRLPETGPHRSGKEGPHPVSAEPVRSSGESHSSVSIDSRLKKKGAVLRRPLRTRYGGDGVSSSHFALAGLTTLLGGGHPAVVSVSKQFPCHSSRPAIPESDRISQPP